MGVEIQRTRITLEKGSSSTVNVSEEKPQSLLWSSERRELFLQAGLRGPWQQSVF